MGMDKQKWFYIILLLIIIIFLYRVKMVLTPFLFAVLIAYAAYPLVVVFEQRQVPRHIAIILVYIIFGTVFGLLVSLLIPELAKEVDELLKVLPRQTEKLEDGLGAVRILENITVPKVLQGIFDLVTSRIQQLLGGLAERLAGFLVSMVSQIICFLAAPFLAFYLLRDLELLKRRMIMSIPKKYRLSILSLTKEINQVCNGFIRGQLVSGMIVGLLIAAGLAIIGIKYSLFIGLLAGLFNIIPYFGPVIGFIPAFMLAIVKSPISVLWVLVVFIAANQIEASIIAPKIVGARVGLHPLAVIFAVLAGGEIMGIIGMLVAVPTAAIIKILYLHGIKRLDEDAEQT